MKIKPLNSNLHQLALRGTEHFIITIMTFLLSLFIILYFGFKRKNNYQILDYLLTHEFIFLFLCLGIAAITNFILCFKNRNNCSIREIEYDAANNIYRIQYRKGYSNRNNLAEISSDSITFKKITKTNILGDTCKLINILNDGKYAFALDLDDAIWSTDKQAIYDLYEMIG